MSNLYVCEEYETPYEEGYRIVRTIEEHNKIIYNQALDDFKNRLLNWRPQDEEYKNFSEVVNEIETNLYRR